MKHNKLFRILAMATILSLLMLAIPATSALAVGPSINLSSSSGPTGTVITVTGSDFTGSEYGYVWFDSDDDDVKDSGEPYDTLTTDGSGNIPSGVTLTVPVVPRGTYRVYADIPDGSTLETYATFTVQPEIDLDDTSGNVGDTITIDGTGFDDNSDITIYFDGDEVTITSGDDDTDSYGTFTSTFVVPDAARGSHTVEVEDEGNHYDTASFSVSQEITLSSSSGAVDDVITITGTGFDDNSDITIYFGGDELTITSGDDDTDSDGSFTCTITIPDTTRGSHTIKAEDEGNHYDTATFTVAQNITIDPTTGSTGTTVTVIGTGFKASYQITITYDGTVVTTSPTTITTNSSGYFSATFTVPASMTGTYEVMASDGTNTATADFVSTTDATISQVTTAAAPGHVGTELTITGTGFTPNATVTVTYETDPVTLASVSTDASGNFTASITIPASLGGAHTITVSDGSVSKTFDFYMELAAPSAPELLLPLIGEKSESEAIFDWDDVTDDSLPVTYDLQVSTSSTFAVGTLLVDEEGLTESGYTLTGEEKLESTGEDEPYYWRVRAIDAASNEGAWSEASTFYVGFTFEFTGWVVYVTMAVIAVAFFFLGWWLGRRRSAGDEFA